jgi:hypothetical protein
MSWRIRSKNWGLTESDLTDEELVGIGFTLPT